MLKKMKFKSDLINSKNCIKKIKPRSFNMNLLSLNLTLYELL